MSDTSFTRTSLCSSQRLLQAHLRFLIYVIWIKRKKTCSQANYITSEVQIWTAARTISVHAHIFNTRKLFRQLGTGMYRTKVLSHTLRKLSSALTNWSDFYDNMAEIKGGTGPLMIGLFQYNHTWTSLYRKNCLLIHNAFTKWHYVRCFVFSLFCSPKVVKKWSEINF